MHYSRRNFLKAAGSGVALTAVGGGVVFTAAAASTLPAPMTKEKATFIINGKPLVAEYEARTTLWEVVAIKLGLTGTTRSCNRASCGACSVLIDGTPFYSCHTLATEAAGKKIFTIEGLGDENHLHPLAENRLHVHGRRLWFLHSGLVGDRQGAFRQKQQPHQGRRKEGVGRAHLPLLGLFGDYPHGGGYR